MNYSVSPSFSSLLCSNSNSERGECEEEGGTGQQEGINFMLFQGIKLNE